MKLAVICGGRTYKEDVFEDDQLKHIGRSVEKVTETLGSRGWKCEPFMAKTTKTYTDILRNYKEETIDEYLFYFTGHGDGSKRTTFKIFLEENTLNIEDLIEETKTTLGRFPKKIALVIDSCYSGNALKYNYYNIEILSSTGDKQGFEKDSLGMSVFSYYFCEVFDSLGESEQIDLESIAEFIKNNQEKQEPLYSKALRRNKIIIGYNKNLNNIKNKIKEHYQNKALSKEKQVDTFKYDILRFYPRVKEENYNGIRNSKSMNDLLDVLLGDRTSSYLYCILKFLEIEDEYLSTFQGSKECIEVNAKVESVVVVVEANTNNDAYRADIYRVLDNGKVEESGKIPERTWENLYKIELVKELEKILALNCVAKLELQMVLPIKLMNSRFKEENLSLYVVEDIFDDFKWEEKFNITTKFLSRLKGYGSEDDNFFSLWDKNLKLYFKRSEETIKANVYCPKAVKNVSNFCDNNALVLVSENSLVDDKNLAKLYSFGIPFVITTQEDKYAFTSDKEYEKWTKSKVKNIRNSSYLFINEMPETLHFLCDDGYSNEFLEIFQNIGNYESKIENFIGEDYE